jgi:hypothetical protein
LKCVTQIFNLSRKIVQRVIMAILETKQCILKGIYLIFFSMFLYNLVFWLYIVWNFHRVQCVAPNKNKGFLKQRDGLIKSLDCEINIFFYKVFFIITHTTPFLLFSEIKEYVSLNLVTMAIYFCLRKRLLVGFLYSRTIIYS